MKLRKGDLVKVVMGKDRGREGKIEEVLSKENKVLVANVNQYKRHLKARSAKQPSEIVTLTKPLPLHNVSLICPNCHLPARVGFKLDSGDKIRVCKKCGKKI